MSQGPSIVKNTFSPHVKDEYKLGLPNPRELLGILVIYGVFVTYIPYFLYSRSTSLFLTYISNVDIVSNILSISIPQYFRVAYDIDPDTVVKYVSFNLISIVALSGIFIHGLKSCRKEDMMTNLKIMVTMAIITFTLPTQLLPILIHRLDGYLQRFLWYKNHHESTNLIMGAVISVGFLLLEWILIKIFVLN